MTLARLAMFAFLFPVFCEAQTFSSTSFERFLNTFFWKNDLRASHRFGLWTVSASHRFQSTLIDLSQRALRDEGETTALLSREVGSTLQLRFEASNYFLSDSRALFRNNAVSNRATFGFLTQPSSRLSLEAKGGFKAERQLAQFNSGFVYDLRGELFGYRFSNFEISSRLNASQEFLTPRRNEDKGAFIALAQRYGRAMLLLSGGISEERRDYFSNVLASIQPIVVIERRIERALYTIDSLSYQTLPNLTTRAKIELRRRSIVRENSQQFSDPTNLLYDNAIEQLRLLTDAALTFETRAFQTTAGVSFQQQSENYRPINALAENPTAISRERFRNNAFQVATLCLSSTWKRINAEGDATHQLAFSAQMRGFRYDTPDTNNADDRDEVSYIVALSDSLRLNRYLGLKLSLSFANAHNVFISRERSANNAQNYVLRFSPSTIWRVPNNIESFNEFGVLANYTVYDFEIGSQTRSFSFRQFFFLDSTQFFLNETLALKLLYEQRLYERAELYWRDFSERPLSRFNDRSLSFELRLSDSSLQASFGIRVFARSQSNFQTRLKGDEAELIETPLPSLLYIGPTARLFCRLSQSVELEASGWHQAERVGGRTVQVFPNVYLLVKAAF
ncbi:MAG: hypothetical protein RMM16_00075 [Chloroherpetonaceae bacterium]|nr:hypothetical protein [Chloroherpetonaceae bacterium]